MEETKNIQKEWKRRHVYYLLQSLYHSIYKCHHSFHVMVRLGNRAFSPYSD